ncbi:MAG: Crp/Fnr family transcriptional regulator [Gammaproteobacteria bacterium]|nr:Crp/Fnr family transcriptional regulator [Gammaproteobacteria bacterium]MBU1731978.1 Crp/Fnr family transcriptional regulator [Gammaproteobacteria bacterium]MBU1893116.1 Crp/Fnr family transcriptional regulator [Gammaproteobacteria bacterium]
MTAEQFSPEQRILRVMRKVLASVVKDVTPQEGMNNPLTDRTIEDIRDIFGMISTREKELLEAFGQAMGDRPFYPGEQPSAKVIPISVGSLKDSRKKIESSNPLSETPLFKGVDLDALDELLDACPVYELKAGEVLLGAGEKNNETYLVLNGRLQADLGTADAPRVMAFEPKQAIGEISVLGESTMSAPVVATEESVVLAIHPDTMWAMMEIDAVLAHNILSLLAHR